jgi:mRNA interferase YafQ
MRAIERTTRFRRDYKREARGRHGAALEASLLAVLQVLVIDGPLSECHRDHSLSGDWAGFRDCHIKPDLVLIYEKPDDDTLRLVRLGSHSELGL